MRKVLKVVTSTWGDTEPVITSTWEGNHSEASLHYFGCALDFRKPPPPITEKIVRLRNLLGSDFDVVEELDHIHVEWDKK